jgi:hypothetical protein
VVISKIFSLPISANAYFNRGGVLQQTNVKLQWVSANAAFGGVLQQNMTFCDVPQQILPFFLLGPRSDHVFVRGTCGRLQSFITSLIIFSSRRTCW